MLHEQVIQLEDQLLERDVHINNLNKVIAQWYGATSSMGDVGSAKRQKTCRKREAHEIPEQELQIKAHVHQLISNISNQKTEYLLALGRYQMYHVALLSAAPNPFYFRDGVKRSSSIFAL